MALNQNINELNYFFYEEWLKSQSRKAQNIDLYLDRKIINVRTARNVVVQLAHPTNKIYIDQK